MKEETIYEVKETLKEIYEEGFEVTDNIKKNLRLSITGKKLEELFVEPDYFFFYLFESFWKLFKNLSENVENPLIQPWIRIIIEQSSDIVFYSEKSHEEKRKVACKYFLCTLGFLRGKHSNLDYDNFLNLISDQKEKANFSKIKGKDYPVKEIHNIWYRLFPKITENEIPDFIEKYFLTIKGNSIKKSQFEIFFRDMSLYHHPNIILGNLEEEFKNKSHLFRCFALISMCGASLVRFAIDKKLYVPDEDYIKKLNEKVNKLFVKLYSGGVK